VTAELDLETRLGGRGPEPGSARDLPEAADRMRKVDGEDLAGDDSSSTS
jgi:hypothetical protein